MAADCMGAVQPHSSRAIGLCLDGWSSLPAVLLQKACLHLDAQACKHARLACWHWYHSITPVTCCQLDLLPELPEWERRVTRMAARGGGTTAAQVYLSTRVPAGVASAGLQALSCLTALQRLSLLQHLNPPTPPPQHPSALNAPFPPSLLLPTTLTALELTYPCTPAAACLLPHAASLAALPRLQELTVAGLHLRTMHSWPHALAGHPQLQSLKLDVHSASFAELAALGPPLSSLPALKDLRLPRAFTDWEHLLQLVAAVPRLTHLQCRLTVSSRSTQDLALLQVAPQGLALAPLGRRQLPPGSPGNPWLSLALHDCNDAPPPEKDSASKILAALTPNLRSLHLHTTRPTLLPFLAHPPGPHALTVSSHRPFIPLASTSPPTPLPPTLTALHTLHLHLHTPLPGVLPTPPFAHLAQTLTSLTLHLSFPSGTPPGLTGADLVPLVALQELVLSCSGLSLPLDQIPPNLTSLFALGVTLADPVAAAVAPLTGPDNSPPIATTQPAVTASLRPAHDSVQHPSAAGSTPPTPTTMAVPPSPDGSGSGSSSSSSSSDAACRGLPGLQSLTLLQCTCPRRILRTLLLGSPNLRELVLLQLRVYGSDIGSVPGPPPPPPTPATPQPPPLPTLPTSGVTAPGIVPAPATAAASPPPPPPATPCPRVSPLLSHEHAPTSASCAPAGSSMPCAALSPVSPAQPPTTSNPPPVPLACQAQALAGQLNHLLLVPQPHPPATPPAPPPCQAQALAGQLNHLLTAPPPHPPAPAPGLPALRPAIELLPDPLPVPRPGAPAARNGAPPAVPHPPADPPAPDSLEGCTPHLTQLCISEGSCAMVSSPAPFNFFPDSEADLRWLSGLTRLRHLGLGCTDPQGSRMEEATQQLLQRACELRMERVLQAISPLTRLQKVAIRPPSQEQQPALAAALEALPLAHPVRSVYLCG